METESKCAIGHWIMQPEVKGLGDCQGKVAGVRLAYSGKDVFWQKVMRMMTKNVPAGGPYLCEARRLKLAAASILLVER